MVEITVQPKINYKGEKYLYRPSWIIQLGIEVKNKNKKGIDGRAPPGVEPAA